MAFKSVTDEWLARNDPRSKKARKPLRNIRVQYKKSPLEGALDEAEAKSAAEHGKRYRGYHRRPLSEKAEAHCNVAMWLMRNKDASQDHCLVVPNAHRGFLVRVRYNFASMSASRAMCLIAHGVPADPGMLALHLCGNGESSCVNPSHLKWGTAKENAHHMMAHKKLPECASLSDKRAAALEASAALQD
jgi:hypothetical protein